MSQKSEWRIARIVSLNSEKEWNLTQKWWGLRRVGSAGLVARGKAREHGHSFRDGGKCVLRYCLCFFDVIESRVISPK